MTKQYPKVAATGVQVTSGAASARAAIPNDGAGVRAKRVRIAATGAAYVRPGDSTVDAAATDILVNVGDSLCLDVSGMTHIAYLQETAAAKINITPLEG